MAFIKVYDDYFELMDTYKDIKYPHIVLLSLIGSFIENGKNDYCYASHSYFAERMHTSEEQIKRYFKVLKDNNIISVEYEKQGWATTSKKVKINNLTGIKNDTCKNDTGIKSDTCQVSKMTPVQVSKTIPYKINDKNNKKISYSAGAELETHIEPETHEEVIDEGKDMDDWNDYLRVQTEKEEKRKLNADTFNLSVPDEDKIPMSDGSWYTNKYGECVTKAQMEKELKYNLWDEGDVEDCVEKYGFDSAFVSEWFAEKEALVDWL